MASGASHDHDELPVIWLLAPEALQPPPDPIRPIPIAISATFATLIFLSLLILYNKKLKAISAEYKDIELENLKASIRVIRPASAVQPSTGAPSPQSARTPPPRSERSPPQSQIERGSDTISELQANTYHKALKDIRDASYSSIARWPSSTSTAANGYYFSPGSPTHDDIKTDSRTERHVVRPESSDYSVSLGPTPLPSHRGSVCNIEVGRTWTRLRLGSEYDGNRTFVQSEANLQLGKGKGTARWD